MTDQQQNVTDFTDHESWLIKSTLDERYGKDRVVADGVDVELRLHPGDRELVTRPAQYWEDGKCKFLLVKVKENNKTGERLYRSQFFYSVRHHYGEESSEYKDLGDCVVNLLKLQEKYEEMQKESPETVDKRGVVGHTSIKGE